MHIDHLKLFHFRNITNASITLHPGVNVFIGDNGQGKTNVLEAIVFLSMGRSFRVNQDALMIQHDAEFCRIRAQIVKLERKTELDVVLSEYGKYLQVNDKPLKRMTEFMGNCNVVLFEPDDINFYTQSPRLRRRDIDFELSKISPRYVDDLVSYNHFLSERNALLKHQNIDHDYFEIVTEQCIDHGYRIMVSRFKFINALKPRLESIYSQLSDSDDSVTLEYKGVCMAQSMSSEAYAEKVRLNFKKDSDFKATQVGIHRDDFIFMMNGTLLQNIASQGQKRMVMIAYKLAIIELIQETMSVTPILCLDDLFSELDASRRNKVLDIVGDKAQVIITTTDKSFVDSHRIGCLFKIIKGRIEEVVS